MFLLITKSIGDQLWLWYSSAAYLIILQSECSEKGPPIAEKNSFMSQTFFPNYFNLLQKIYFSKVTAPIMFLVLLGSENTFSL